METYNAKPWKQNICYTDTDNISVLAPRGVIIANFVWVEKAARCGVRKEFFTETVTCLFEAGKKKFSS